MIFENALITWLMHTGTTHMPYHAHVILAAATRARDARDARDARAPVAPYQYVTRIIHHTALSTTRARI